jgi:hypothetical protein
LNLIHEIRFNSPALANPASSGESSATTVVNISPSASSDPLLHNHDQRSSSVLGRDEHVTFASVDNAEPVNVPKVPTSILSVARPEVGN